MGQIMEQYLDDALKEKKAWIESAFESESRLRRALKHLEEAENKIAELEQENRALNTRLSVSEAQLRSSQRNLTDTDRALFEKGQKYRELEARMEAEAGGQ